jgi:flagellar hook-length control protein FliK
MNATPPVSLSQFGNDASQLNSAASDSAVPGANSQDFAKALSDAGGKPSRKATIHGTAGRDPSGSHLPGAGNSSPSLPPPSPAARTPTAATPTAATPTTVPPTAGTPTAAPGAAGLSTAASLAAAASGAVAAAAGSPASGSPAAVAQPAAAAQPATAEIPAGAGTEPSQTAPTAPLIAGGESSRPAAKVEASAPAAVTDAAQGLNNSLEAALNANQPATAVNVAVTAAAGSPKGNDPSGSAAASLPASPPLMIRNAAVRAAPSPAARPVNGDSPSSQAAQAPAPRDRSAFQSETLAANGTPESADTGANAAALPATMVHVGEAPASQAPAGDSISPGTNLALQDASVRQQDAAMTNAAQANAAQANAAAIAARAPATALATPAGQIAAAAAGNAQALLTRASVAADKPAASSDAMPSLSLDSGAAAGAAQLLANPPVPTQAASPVLNVAASVDSTEFGQGVAGQVSFMVDRNLNSASLQVNPPSLGPIEVRIALQGGHAQVWMTSHSAVTRDALESSSSKLREMLGTQGFGQVSVDISQRSFQERSSQSQTYSALPPMERRAALGAAGQRSAGTIPRAASGLVDAYA